jgi:hypothetical protein
MNSPDYLAAAAALFSYFTFERLIPLMMMFSMGCLFLWVLFKAQRRPDFDASMFLRNDRGMLASERLWGFLCFMVHTWYIAVRTLSEKIVENDVIAYGVLWSGTAVAIHFIDAWRGVRTNTPPPDNPMPPATVHAPPQPQPPEESTPP